MPEVNESGVNVDLDEYKREKEEFANAVDEIFAAEEGDTDEIIDKRIDDREQKDEAGIATRDLDARVQKDFDDKTTDTPKEDDPTQGQSGTGDPVDPAATGGDDQVDWKARAEAAEADLAKEKQKTSSWAGRIKKANDEVATMKAAAAAVPSEEDKTDQAKLDKFREDFPELGDVVDVMERKINKVAPAIERPDTSNDVDNTDGSGKDPEILTSEDDDEVKPSEHYNTTREAHPDLDEAVNSGVLLTWINKQPVYIQPHLKAIYNGGSAKQVVDMVTEFKDKSGWKSQLDKTTGKQTDKLKQQLVADGSESAGPVDRQAGPDKNDFQATAKAIGL